MKARDGLIALGCAVAGCVLLLASALIPARLRTVDRGVLQAASQGTPSVVAIADRFVAEDRAGPAAMLLRWAEAGDPAAAESGFERIRERMAVQSALARWGGPNEWLDRHLGGVAGTNLAPGTPVLDWLLPAASRQAFLRALVSSSEPAVIALLACRKLETTAILPPVSSASGQPLDAALLVAAAMIQVPRAHAGLALDLERGAMAATQGQASAPLEGLLLDLLAAARRLDWEQLATLLERCEDGPSLHQLIASAGGDERQWETLYAGVAVGSSGRQVAAYVRRHDGAGIEDLGRALAMGEGALRELLRRGQPIHDPQFRGWLVRLLGLESLATQLAGMAYRAPGFAFAGRLLLGLDGLFLLVLGLWYVRRAFLDERHPSWRGKPDLRVLTVLTGTLGVVLFLAGERFLVLKYGAAGGRAASSLPVIRARLRFDLPHATNSVMNEKVIGMLVTFFVIQLAIYLIGLSRLRSIRGQAVEDPIKLRLLDNEETVFDAPLYVGIAGSVLALVMRLTGFEEVSLMASYSSTLFGILFCFVLKVMHVRPYRQQLILQSAEKRQP